MQHTIERMAEQLLIENYEKYYRLAYLHVKSEADALDLPDCAEYGNGCGSFPIRFDS